MRAAARRAVRQRAPGSAQPRSCRRPSGGRETKARRRCLRSGCSRPADRPCARNIAGARDRLRRSAWNWRIVSSEWRMESAIFYSLFAISLFAALLILEHQRMDRKISAGIGPHADRRPSRSARQRAEGFERVLVAVFGVDGLAGAHLDGSAGDPHLLAPLAGEVHLDAVALGIVEGMVAEACEVEVAVELAIDARQQVEVEPGRDA